AVANLAGGKDALQKSPPKAPDGGSDARDLHNINAGADDHGWRSERSQVRELRCCEEGNTLRIRVLSLLGAKPPRRNCLGVLATCCYHEVARLIDVVRSSFLPSSNPCLHHIPIELQLHQQRRNMHHHGTRNS